MGEDFGPKVLAALSSRDFLKEEEDGFAGLFGSCESDFKVARPLYGSKFHRLIPLGVTTGGKNDEEKEEGFHEGGRVWERVLFPASTLYELPDWCLITFMKRILLLLAACLTPLFAELPQMSDKTEWLGYFVGWEQRNFDFGIGSDGELLMHPKKSNKRGGHKELSIHYVVEEEVKGRWVRRQFLKEDGLSSENEKGLDPQKPVVVVTTVTGETKVEWTHVVSRGQVVVTPKLLEKKTGNKIRIGMEFALPRLYRFTEKPDKRELRKKVGSDYLRGTRLKDGKKVRIKFDDVDNDITGEKFLRDGASDLEVKSKGILDKKVTIGNGSEKAGRLDVVAKGPLYNSFKMIWMADMAKLGDKGTCVTFAVE